MSEKIDPLGVFGESLGAASGANRFRQPALSPGERTLALEEQMCVLESRLSERVMRALDGANLTTPEREALLGRMLAFLSDRDLSKGRGLQSPDVLAFFDEVDMMLARFGTFERERADALREIAGILSDDALRRAA